MKVKNLNAKDAKGLRKGRKELVLKNFVFANFAPSLRTLR